MRRIVVIAASIAGVRCATRIKRRLPEHEVNVIVPASIAGQKEEGGPVARRYAACLPNLELLASREVGVLEAQDIMPDLEGHTVTVTSSRGKLGIRYTDLIIETPATVRLPRALQKTSNVFGWPAPDFSEEPALCDQALAGAAASGMPVVVVGGGLAALDAVCMIRQAGAKAHWLRVKDVQAPGLEPHLTALILQRLGEEVLCTDLGERRPDALSWSLSGDGSRLESLHLPGGTSIAASCCFWTAPLMGRHPILREDGVLLDTLGRITTTDGVAKHLGLHVMGSGAAVPDTVSEVSGAVIRGYPGGEESTAASQWAVVEAVAAMETDLHEEGTAAPGVLGIRRIGMPGVCVMRAGLSLEEAQAQGVEVEYALVPASGVEEDGAMGSKASAESSLLVLALVCHKTTRVPIGVQALGFDADPAAVSGLFGMALTAMAQGVSTVPLGRRFMPGLAGSMLAAAASIINHKLDTVVKGISADELLASREAGAEFFTLDLRSMPDWRAGHVEGAYNIPLTQLKKRLQDEVPRFTPLVLISADGRDAYAVASKLAGLGATDLYVLDGGMALWPYALQTE